MRRFYAGYKEMKDESAGLLAAAFIGIVPGYISRSVAGSYDNEAIAIFLLMFTFLCMDQSSQAGKCFLWDRLLLSSISTW
jgi:dolichyl-diphosphooligosaccharide--protein glycosyltransferase